MVDIETYRAKIGSFGASGLSTIKLKLKIKLRCKVQRQVSMECSVQTLIFLLMVTSMMLCVSLHYQEQGNTYTGTTPSHTDSLYSDTQLCIKCLYKHVHELYRYILESYVGKLTEMSLFYTPSHRSSLASNIWTPGTNTQATLMENIFNGTVHGTCSYLIGNVGSHAYHGNPPKKSGPEIYDIHSAMVLKLSKTIAPTKRDDEMKTRWHYFTSMLCRPDLLSDAEITGLRSMFDVFRILMAKGKIDYGNYEVVKRILSELELIQCLDIITQHEEQMTSTPKDVQETARSHDTPVTVYSRDTAETGYSQDTAETVNSRDTAETGYSRDTAQTGYSQDTAQTGCSQDTAETVYSRDTAETGYSRDTAETGYSRDSAATVYSWDTAETGYSRDTAETVYSGDTAETGYSGDTAESGYSRDKVSTDIVYGQDKAASSQNNMPSVPRKRSRDTSPQPGSSSHSEKRFRETQSLEGELALKVDVVSESPPSSDKNLIYDAMMDFLLSVLGKILAESKTTAEMLTQFDEWLLSYDKVRARRKCLMIYVACGSRKTLNDLWQMYQSGKLLEILQNGLITRDLLAKCGMESIQLGVFISEEDYKRCLRNIAEPVTTDHAVTTTRQAIDARGYKLESGKADTDTEMKSDITEIEGEQGIKPETMETEGKQETRDTEDIQLGIMGMETIQDTRDTEGIQPGIVGIETQQDTRDTEVIQPGIMGIETQQDTRNTEDIQPGIMAIKTKQDTRDTEDIQLGIMGLETIQDTKDTEGMQPGIVGIETQQDTRNTEDIQPGIMAIKTKQDTRDTEDIQLDIMGLETIQDTKDTEGMHPGIVGIETQQDTRDTEDIQPGIMGMKTQQDARDTEGIQPGIVGIETQQDTRDTEDIQPGIMGIKTKQDARDTEDIQPDIVGIKTKQQDNRDTEDIQPDIMGIEKQQDTRDTEDIQPDIMGIEKQQDTRDTENIQPGFMGIKTIQDTRNTEDIQPDMAGIETQQDTRNTEDIQPGIMAIKTKQDTRDTEDIQLGIMGLETIQDTKDTEGMQPGIVGIETQQDTRNTEDIQPGIMAIKTKQDTRDTEDIQLDIMGLETIQDTKDTEGMHPGIVGIETQQDTRDTEDIQPGIMGMKTQQDARDTEGIQPGIVGIETQQDTRDTEDIQPGIMGIKTKQDARDTEDIQPDIVGIKTKQQDNRDTEDIQPDIMGIEKQQDTRDTEDIQPDIMGIEKQQDTRDTENIQPGFMGIKTIQDTRNTEDIQPDIMGIESKQDTRDTEDIQPGIIGMESKQDIRDTEDIQPGIMGLESKKDTRDTEDIQPGIIGMETQQDIEDTTAGECSIDTPLFKEDNNVDTAVEKDITETGQDFKEWVPPTAGIVEQLIVKREEFRTYQEDVVDVLAQHATGFGAAQTVYSRDTAASSHNKMPSVDMEASVKAWRNNDKLCYETKGIEDVVQKICSDKHSYICVVGEPGCGKSIAIRHAALYLKDKFGFIIYPVSGPKQFVDYLDPDKAQVGVIDDIIGEYFIDQDKLKVWDEYNEKIKDWLQIHKNTKFLFSLRAQLYSELKSKGNTHIYNDQRHVINFSDKEYKLSRDIMQNMLRHYLQVQHVQNIEGLIKEVRWEGEEQFAGCFPLLCKVFSEDESVRVNPGKYFSHPWPALQNIFKQIKSKNKHQFCGLLLCGITDLKDEYFSTSYKQNKPQQFDSLIESQNLDPRKDLSDIKSALQALDGVYISHIGNRYTFLHSIFQNIVTFLYDDKYYVLKYATVDFIHTRVRLFSKFDTDDDYVKVFYGDDCVELLVDRMTEELRSDDRYRWWKGVSFIVNSHYIDNKDLITCLMEKLFDSKHTQITQYKIDRLFVVCLDTVCRYKPSPPHTDVTSCPQYQLLLSLIARCDCNKQIERLWPGYPLLVSVDCGSLPVTKALVEHQADVNVVDSRYKCCVLHLAVDCRNNVDMTKYLLSLPNLKCLNHRDSDGHTPYWYVVNNISPRYWPVVPHRDELMKLYKHKAAIL